MTIFDWYTETNTSIDIFSADCRISNITLGWQIELEVTGPSLELAISLDLEFSLIEGGIVLKVDPEIPETHNLVHRLLGQSVTEVNCYQNGRLRLITGEGLTLICEPHEMYEPWELRGSYGLRVISLPGGGLGVWKPVPEPT